MEVDIRIMDTSLNNNTLHFKIAMRPLSSSTKLPNRLNTIQLTISVTRIKSSHTSTNNLLKDAMEGNQKGLHHPSQSIQAEKMMNICMQISNLSLNKIMKLHSKSAKQLYKTRLNLLVLSYVGTQRFILQIISLKFHLLLLLLLLHLLHHWLNPNYKFLLQLHQPHQLLL